MRPDELNLVWARALVGELSAGGASCAVVCPGARSAPLAIACLEQRSLRTWSVVDERSAGFFALGLSKGAGAPPILVCTSGTAGAHFHPAVIEAAHTGTGLLILTADRPWELHGWGAVQTIDQHALYGRYASFVPLGLPEESLLPHLRATAARAAAQAREGAIVHLNAPFREPLVGPHPPPVGPTSAPLRFAHPLALPDVEDVRRHLESVERGVIVCGPIERSGELGDAIARLADALGYPVLADAGSGARFGNPLAISAYDALLSHEPFAARHRPDVVLRFGGTMVSKVLQRWLDASGAYTICFAERNAFVDPSHRGAHFVGGDVVAACRALTHRRHGPRTYLESFLAAARIADRALEHGSLDEPMLAREVVAAMPAGANLVVSSSMPVRDVDAFGSASRPPMRVFGHRGTNGIDGLVSSAAGVAASTGARTVLLAGDLALLHDLGGLLLARRHRLSLTVVVANNDGGGIFHFLPVASAHGFEELFATPHGVDLASVAALANARLHRPQTREQLRSTLELALEGGLHLVEVRTDRRANVEAHRAAYRRVAASLGEGPWA